MAKTNLDDETTAALTLFNEYVAADRERTQREKRLKKAERAKDEAAALVKKLSKGGAVSKERTEAEGAYLAAAEQWMALRDGKEPPEDPKGAKADEADEAQDEAESAESEDATDTDKAAEPGSKEKPPG